MEWMWLGNIKVNVLSWKFWFPYHKIFLWFETIFELDLKYGYAIFNVAEHTIDLYKLTFSYLFCVQDLEMLGTKVLLHLLQMGAILSQHQTIPMSIFGTTLRKGKSHSLNQNPWNPSSVSPPMPLLPYRGLVSKLGTRRTLIARIQTSYPETQQIHCLSPPPPPSRSAKTISWTQPPRDPQPGQRKSFPPQGPEQWHHQSVNPSTNYSRIHVRARPILMRGV